PNTGAAMCAGGSNNLYVLSGNSSNGFWNYSTSGNTWSVLSGTPAAATTAGTMCYGGGNVYAAINGANKFYSYSVAAGTWSTPVGTPGTFAAGAALCYDANNSTVYAFIGTSTTFESTSNGGASWTTTLATAPVAVAAGASLCYPGTGDYIYAFQGGTA